MTEKTKTSFNFLKSFFELSKTYWGYFMTFVAIVTFIWTIGVKSERDSMQRDSIKRDIEEIKQIQKKQGQKIDDILIIVNDVNQSQIEVVESQNALRKSYVNFVANFNEITQKGLTMTQFIEYMEGLEFSLKTPPIVERDSELITVVNPQISSTSTRVTRLMKF